jgi:hypothetical protein
VSIISVENTSFSPTSEFRSELKLGTSFNGARIAFALDKTALDEETAKLVEETLGAFGIMLALSAEHKAAGGVDLVSKLKQSLLAHLNKDWFFEDVK